MRNSSSVHQCKRCGKTLSSAANLRYHTAKATPCVAPQAAIQQAINIKKTKKLGNYSKTKCFKCRGMCTCSQNRRLYLSRPTEAKKTNAERGTKLNKKKFSTRLHMDHQSGDIDMRPSLKESKKKAFKTLDLSRPDTELTTKGLYSTSLAMTANQDGLITTRGPTNEAQGLVNQPQLVICATLCERNDGVKQHFRVVNDTANSLSFKRKRSADDGSDMSPVGEVIKRAQCDTGSFPELDAPTSTYCNQWNVMAEHEKTKHGGDILTDGCCCRQCVRKWTRKMASRMTYLSDEVANLRRQLAAIDRRSPLTEINPRTIEATEPSIKVKRELPKTDCLEAKPCTGGSVQHCTEPPSAKEDLKPGSAEKFKAECPTKPPCPGKVLPDAEKIVLTEKYNHLNDQIFTNERALQDSLAFLHEMSSQAKPSNPEIRSQLDELRVYIDMEKHKRDEAVAAIIAHRWNAQRTQFRLLLENVAVKGNPGAEKAFHEECVEIATQLVGMNEVLLRLDGQIRDGSFSNTGKTDSVSCSRRRKMSKYALEKTTKEFLERQRNAIFMCLLRSSPRIYTLTKEKLLEDKK